MIEATKLTEKSMEVFEYVKAAGGKCSLPELVNALGRTDRSIGANLTDLKKKGFGEREKVEVEGHCNLGGQRVAPFDVQVGGEAIDLCLHACEGHGTFHI